MQDTCAGPHSLDLPESERLCRHGIWVGQIFFLDTKRDLEHIVEAFHKVRKLVDKLMVDHRQAAYHPNEVWGVAKRYDMPDLTSGGHCAQLDYRSSTGKHFTLESP